MPLGMRTEYRVRMQVCTFVQGSQIIISQLGAVIVGVGVDAVRLIYAPHVQAVIEALAASWNPGFKQAIGMP